MIARIYTKPQVKSMLNAVMKVKGFTVEKLKSGYKVTYKTVDGEDKLVFKAMNGHNSYLVRHPEYSWLMYILKNNLNHQK